MAAAAADWKCNLIESDEDEVMGDNHSNELTQMIDEELEELLDL